MKISRLLLAILLFSIQCTAVEVDKAAHFGVGGMAQAACEAVAGNLFRLPSQSWHLSAVCFLSVSLAAGFKEGFDARNGGNADFADFAAGVAGAAATTLLIKVRF